LLGLAGAAQAQSTYNVTEPVGQTSAPQTATVTFTSTYLPFGVTPSIPFGNANVLIQGVPNQDFIFAGNGTCNPNVSYNPGDTCTVLYLFRPKLPGVRLGGITLTSGSAVSDANPGGVIASAFISGLGVGPQVTYNTGTPAISTLGGGISEPTGVAVDAAGNVYVADNRTNEVDEIAPNCPAGDATCVTSLGGGFKEPYGVAVDGLGNVYVADYVHKAVKEMPPNCTTVACVTTLGGGFSYILDVAVDGAGNVYVGDGDNNAVKEMPPNCTTAACVTTLGGGFQGVQSLAVDGAGNVYVGDGPAHLVKEMTPNCPSGSTACVTTLGAGFSTPTGLAVDGAGNVYVADFVQNSLKEMSPNCPSGDTSCVRTLDSAFSSLYGVAIDGTGNLYVTTGSAGSVQEIGFATAPTLSFSTPTADGGTDTADGPELAMIANIGNAPLLLESGYPSISTGFNLGTESTACGQLGNLTLNAASSCTLTASFAPVLPQNGAVSGTIALLDNNLNMANAAQGIGLSGTAIGPPPLPSLTLFFGGSASTLPLGGDSNFFVSLTNPSGTAALSNFSVAVALPSGLRVVPNSFAQSCSSTLNYSTTSISFSGITLAAGSSCQVGVALTAVALGQQTLSGTATVGGQSTASSATSIVVTEPVAGPGFTLAAASGGVPATVVAAGSVVALTATVSNPPAHAIVSFCNAAAAACAGIDLLGTAALQVNGNVGTATLNFVPGIGRHSYSAKLLGGNWQTGTSSANVPLTVDGDYATNTTVTIAPGSGPGNYTLDASVTAINGPAAPSGSILLQDVSVPSAATVTAPIAGTTITLGYDDIQEPSVADSDGGFDPQFPVVADFNGDGHPDLAVVKTNGRVAILLNQGNGTFDSPLNTVLPSDSASGLVTADFNGDGYADLAVGSDQEIAILLGNGDGTFAQQSATASVPANLIVSADFNGDGIADLATANQNAVNVLLGNGDGTFSALSDSTNVNGDVAGMTSGDFNGDGVPDLAIPGSTSCGCTFVLLGNGDGTFQVSQFSLPAVRDPGELAVADFNGDGKLDLAATTNGFSDPTVVIALGNGDGTFSQAQGTVASVPYGVGPPSVGDINGDGVPDLAFAGFGCGCAYILTGNGDGTFQPAVEWAPNQGSPTKSTAVGDFDGDGFADLALINDINAVSPTLPILLTRQKMTATATPEAFVPEGGPYWHAVDGVYTGDVNYQRSVSSPTLSLFLPHSTQPISFTTIPTQYVNASVPLNASGPGGPITFSASGPCLISGTTVVVANTAGTCSVTATQAGNAEYPASAAIRNFQVLLNPPNLVFNKVANTAVQGVATFVSTTASTSPVVYISTTPAVCSVNSGTNTATMLKTGTCTIQASVAANSAYGAATASRTFTVTLAPQTIAFTVTSPQTLGKPLTLNASSTSGLTISYSSSTTSVCTVSGSTATLLKAGTCTITASQAGDGVTYAAAASVTKSFTVVK